MLMASMRLNIPMVFVSGGPMEAGNYRNSNIDLIDTMVSAADDAVSDKDLYEMEMSACPTCGSCSGMFTANSMNCLVEALGLALPGNGTVLATHSNRLKLFQKAAKLIVDLANRYYYDGDPGILPRSIATKQAFINAMSLDIAMGGSTNTVLHLLAIANEAGVDFTMKDIDELSQRIPNICKVSPSSKYHIQDVNRAGGILSIMGELERNNLIDSSTQRIDYKTLHKAIADWDIMSSEILSEAKDFWLSAPSMQKSLEMGSQSTYYDRPDTDRKSGCIRSVQNAYNKDGGLAVLYGNIARNGCIVKTAGIDLSILKFKGPAIIFESQEEAADGILKGMVNEGDAVIIRYEGPKGGPGMQEMLYPTSYLKSKLLDKKCALITDGRFSGGTSGLSIGHLSPEAAAGGEIAVLRTGDLIEIDVTNRKINALISDNELVKRLDEEKLKGETAFRPLNRNRVIPPSLKAYALFVSSADKGAVRII
jgi:dihydroxy-acid dehydratase